MTERGAIPNEGRCRPNPNISLMLRACGASTLSNRSLDPYPTAVHLVVATKYGGSGDGCHDGRCGQYESTFVKRRWRPTNALTEHLRNIIGNLYWILVQAYDYNGIDESKLQLSGEIKSLITNLQELTRTSRRLPTTVPVDLIQYVEDKRNPDVYKRQIVELVMQYNQLQKGRAQAFADFRDILGREMMSAIPDMRDDVRTVLKAAGGQVDE
jgi:mediator of RNA polymerase II transcription subunit 10